MAEMNIEYPNISDQTPEGQLRQVKDYLFLLADKLCLADSNSFGRFSCGTVLFAGISDKALFVIVHGIKIIDIPTDMESEFGGDARGIGGLDTTDKDRDASYTPHS